MAVSVLKCGLLPLTQTAMRWGKIAYHDFEGVAVELDERERLVEDLGDCEVMILRNHGLLSVGQTIGQAFNNIYRLERACETQLLAHGLQQRNLHAAAARHRQLQRPAHGRAVAGRQGQEPAARLAGMAGAEADARPARPLL